MKTDLPSVPANAGKPADVCLVLEGTYPYVSGGVSSWVHSLVRGLPDVTFSLSYIGADRATRPDMQYQLPPNVVALNEFYIHDHSGSQMGTGTSRSRLTDDEVRRIEQLHQEIRLDARPRYGDVLDLLKQLGGPKAPVPGTMLRSEESWELLQSLYRRFGGDASYVDYYWTFVFTHLPVFALIHASLPQACLYHSVSTGYAGFAAAIAKMNTGRPMMITEHGVYTHERELEIAQANWIYAAQASALNVTRTRSLFKQWWIDFFKFLSRVAYQCADDVITITENNIPYQLQDGADPGKLRVISNGIDVKRFAEGRRKPDTVRDPRFTVGFVGRVVPIKDVKTLLRAIGICKRTVPDISCVLVGPTDEDEEYYENCVRLASDLGIQQNVKFVGKANVLAYYQQFDAVVLTSISEAVPLVILEASCAGLPVIASDVGACREMLVGRPGDDQALGPSGLVTSPASPEQTAASILKLYADPGLRARMGKAGIQRVDRYYRVETVHEEYRRTYQKFIELSRTAN